MTAKSQAQGRFKFQERIFISTASRDEFQRNHRCKLNFPVKDYATSPWQSVENAKHLCSEILTCEKGAPLYFLTCAIFASSKFPPFFSFSKNVIFLLYELLSSLRICLRREKKENFLKLFCVNFEFVLFCASSKINCPFKFRCGWVLLVLSFI